MSMGSETAEGVPKQEQSLAHRFFDRASDVSLVVAATGLGFLFDVSLPKGGYIEYGKPAAAFIGTVSLGALVSFMACTGLASATRRGQI